MVNTFPQFYRCVLLVILLCSCFVFESNAKPLAPIDLRCEYLRNPLGIDIKKPRFSWSFGNNERDQWQSAYEIFVSSSESSLRSRRDLRWSSGRINSTNSVSVIYDGEALRPFTRYYWQVMVFNKEGEAALSEIAWFETAMLDAGDWKGNWITAQASTNLKQDMFNPDGMPLFRKRFSSSKDIVSARLYIAGLGYYEASLNGKRVGDRILDPGWTAYGKEVLYSTYDVTALLKKGTNTIGVMTGNGWWNPLPIKLFGRWDIRDYQQTGSPCLRAELRISYRDGTIDVIPTDGSWETAEGPVRMNSVYLGEHYDSRHEIARWNENDEQKSKWKPVTVGGGPRGTMSAQMNPPVRVIEIVRPVKITNPRPDTFIVDMGVNFAGVARIRVKGPRGTTVSLRYGEDIMKDGTLNYHTSVMTQIRKGGIPAPEGAPETAWQEDRYTLRGGGVEVWSPRFTFHGFRYVEIVGWPGKPTLNDIEGLRMSAALEEDGTFACSNAEFNKIQEATLRTFRSNVFSVQSDCPAREKLGYGADIVVTANAFIYNYDMATFYRKAVRDFANDQQSDGGITETAPFVGIADRGYGGNSGPLGWQLGYPFVQQQLYMFYGDKRIIEEHYQGFKKQMDFLKEHAVGGLFHWDIGDHEALDPRAEAFSAASFYYHHALLAAEFAGILKNNEDSTAYAKLAENIKRLIVRKYHVPGTGRFDNATQAAQIFALWYDLSPEKDKTFKVLSDEFERHNWHVSSGIFGVKMMFDVLREMNRNDLAYRIANQPDYPGWINMTRNGATTLWETWRYPEKYPSQNHPMFGSISEWFFRSLLGINPGAPGFEKIIIKPMPTGDLTWAKGQYRSVRGVIESAWRNEGGVFSMQVAIPGNTSAQIWLPVNSGQRIFENGISKTALTIENGYALINVTSGRFAFEVK